jgi:hypothetical protein
MTPRSELVPRLVLAELAARLASVSGFNRLAMSLS